MKVTYHPAAEAELIEAAEYLNERRAGLGQRLVDAVDAAIARILENPKQFPLISHGARRAHCRRFPYGVVFLAFENEILIFAVMHLSRRPEYWKYRMPSK